MIVQIWSEQSGRKIYYSLEAFKQIFSEGWFEIFPESKDNMQCCVKIAVFSKTSGQ